MQPTLENGKPDAAPGGETGAMLPPEGKVLRFRESERLMHWAIAVPFLVCFGTALILVFVYNPAPNRPLRALFSWTHRISGICFILFPMLAAFRARRDLRIHLYNIKQAWLWTLGDVKWLSLMGLAAISSKIPLPEQGKFNAAEKLNFMMLMTTYPLFILTGVLVWLPGIAFYSWILHFGMAVIAAPLLAGHIFMATLNPGTRVGLQGMVTGYVDRQWAKHHYSRWYREHFGKESLEAPVRVRCPSCQLEQELVSWAQLLRTIYEGQPLVCTGCAAPIEALSVTSEPRSLDSLLRTLERSSGTRPEATET